MCIRDRLWNLLVDFATWIAGNKVIMTGLFIAIGAAILLAIGPATAAIAAVVALIAFAGYVRDNWDPIKQWWSDLWSGMGQSLLDTWTSIKDFVLQPFVDAVATLTTAWSGISDWFTTMWNNVGTSFATAWQGITDLLFPSPSYGQQIANVWGNIVTNIQAIFQ